MSLAMWTEPMTAPLSLNMGDVVASSAAAGGYGALSFEGSGAQSVSLGAGGKLCTLKVNKPAGTLTYNSDLALVRHYTHVAGLVNANSKTIRFVGTYNDFTPGDAAYYNIECAAGVHVMVLGGAAQVANDLLLTSGRVSQGTMTVLGDVSVGASFTGGSTALRLAGTTPHNLSSLGVFPASVECVEQGSVLVFKAGDTFKFDKLALQGGSAGSGERIAAQSSIAGSPYYFVVGSEDLSCVDISDCDASGSGHTLDAKDNCGDLGGNVNIDFGI